MTTDPANQPAPVPATWAQPTPLMAIIVGGLGLLLGCLACGGVAALFGTGGLGRGQHSALPPITKKDAKLRIVTTNYNPLSNGRGVVKEISGPWVLMEDLDSPDRTYWISFNHVIYCRPAE